MDNDKWFTAGILFGMIFGVILIGVFIPDLTCNTKCETAAIELNLAQYNQKTGNFEWLDNDIKKLKDVLKSK